METSRPSVDNVRVFCRFRPLNLGEHGGGICVRIDGLNHVTCRVQSGQRVGRCNGNSRPQATLCNSTGEGSFNQLPSTDVDGDLYRFSFSRVYPSEARQREVYDEVARPIVSGVMHGYNGTVLVYGQTGSGKTHTMFGPYGTTGRDRDHSSSVPLSSSGNGGEEAQSQSVRAGSGAGIVPRAVHHIFNVIHGAEEAIEFEIRVMFVEVYMERVRDLLDETNHNLQVREGPSGFYVENCKLPYVTSVEEVMQLIQSGVRRRVTATTACNEASSRSHCVLNITVKSVNRSKGTATIGKLFLVDLAGSEKVAKTHVDGMQLEEAKMINKSLTTLGYVIMCLADKQTHVPYRDSKLTRILKDSLGGNSRTALVVCCSPSQFNDQETLSTLRFGARAQNVCNVAVVNKQLTTEELRRMLDSARLEIKRLRQLLQDAGSAVPAENPHPGKGSDSYPSGIDGQTSESVARMTRAVDRAGPVPPVEVMAMKSTGRASAVSCCDVTAKKNFVNEEMEVPQKEGDDQFSRATLFSEIEYLRGALQECQGTADVLRSQFSKQTEVVKLLREENSVWEEEYGNVMRELYGYRRYVEYSQKVLEEMNLAVGGVPRRISLYKEHARAILAMARGNVNAANDDVNAQQGECTNSQREGQPTVELGDLAAMSRGSCSSVSNNFSQPLLSSRASGRTTVLSTLSVGGRVAGSSELRAGVGDLPTLGMGRTATEEDVPVRKSDEELRGRLAAALDEVERLQSANHVLSLDLQLAERRLQIRNGRIESLKFGLLQESASNQELQQTLDKQLSLHRAQLQAARNDALYWRQHYDDLLNNCHISNKKRRGSHGASVGRRSFTPTLEAVLITRSPSARASPSAGTSPCRGVIVKPIRGGGNRLEHALA